LREFASFWRLGEKFEDFGPIRGHLSFHPWFNALGFVKELRFAPGPLRMERVGGHIAVALHVPSNPF
jgi:hypothetical protein